jgi:hypothetical protein
MSMDTSEAELIKFSASRDGRAILFLTPLAIVAWVEGAPDLDELVEIAAHHARGRCREELGCLSSQARRFFYFHFVYGRPSPSLVGRSLTLLAKALSKLPEGDVPRLMKLLSSACNDVARTGGGPLPSTVSEAKRWAIREMMEFVRPHHAGGGAALAADLGFAENNGGRP